MKTTKTLLAALLAFGFTGAAFANEPAQEEQTAETAEATAEAPAETEEQAPAAE